MKNCGMEKVSEPGWGEKREQKGRKKGYVVILFLLFFLLGSVLGNGALAAGNDMPEQQVFHVEKPKAPERREMPDRVSIPRRSRGTGEWIYYPNESGGITLYAYNGSDSVVTVPAEMDGLPVTEICDTFQGNTTIESVTIPASVTLLNEYTFYECTGLQTLYFESGETLEIRNCVFLGCSSLKNVYGLGNTKVWLEEWSFAGCSALISMPIRKIMSLGESCFSDCSVLSEEYVLDSSIQAIPDHAFRECTNLRRITGLEHTAVTIGDCAFLNCTSLTVFPVGTITGLGEWCFGECAALSENYLIDGVTAIADSAFCGCSSLNSVTLSPGLKTIEAQAFFQCTSLTALELPDGLLEIGDAACYDLTGVQSIDIPDSVETIGNNAFSWDTELIVGDGSAAHQYALNELYQSFQIRGTVVDDEIGKDATTVEEMVDAIVEALITPEMTDYEKALVLHDYLTRTANYDETYTRYKPEHILLGEHLGVCQAYTEAYGLLLNKVGIPNCFEYGKDHIWNMVQLSGEWVHIDCTWDDPIGGGYENHVFFAITNYALEGVSSHECFDKPHIATDPTKSYAYRYGMLDRKTSGIQGKLQQALDEGAMTVQLTSDVLTNDDGNGVLDRLSIQTVMYLGLVSSWNRIPTITPAYQVANWGGTAKIDMDFDIPESSTVYLPSGLEMVESEALAGTAPEKIVFGNGVTALAEDFTESEHRFLVIVAPKNSPAWEWAEERNILRKEP